LSKCHKLRYLDLCKVHEKTEFVSMERAISHLRELDTLFLPPLSFFRTDEDAAGIWPSSLKCLWLTGVVKLAAMPSFVWPPALESLVFQHCRNFRMSVLERILRNPQLESLLSLSFYDISFFYGDEVVDNDVIYCPPNLVYLGIPRDFLWRFMILPPPSYPALLPIKVLEVIRDFHEEGEPLNPEQVIAALTSNLANLRALRLPEWPAFPDSCVKEIDRLLWRHILALPQERLEAEDLYYEDIGIVVSEMGYEEARTFPDVERTIRFPAYRYME
jgi:hypothetical protein